MTTDPRLLSDDAWGREFGLARDTDNQMCGNGASAIRADRAARVEREAILVALLKRCLDDSLTQPLYDEVEAEIGGEP